MIKLIISKLKYPFVLLRNWYISLLIRFHGRPAALKKAITIAVKLHAENGRRYRVFFIGMRYRVFDRYQIKGYKKSGSFGYNVNSTGIDKHKFFDTNTPS